MISYLFGIRLISRISQFTGISPYNADSFYIIHGDQSGFFQFESIINVLVSSF